MTKFVSRRGVLGVAKETSRGVAVAPAYWLGWANMAFFDGAEKAAENQGLGQIADQDSEYVTQKYGQGTIDAQLYDNGLGYILMSLLGAVPNTTGTNPYTHTFTLSQTNQAQSLSLYWKDPDRSYIFRLGVVDSLRISIAANGLVEYTVGFKSKTAMDYSSQTANFTSMGSKFLHQHLQLRLASSIAGLSGASKTSVKSLEITLNNNTMFDSSLGTVEPVDILRQALSVEGQLTLNLTDDTFRNNVLNGTYQAMEIKLFNSSSSSLQLQFPRVSYSSWEPDFGLDTIAGQTVNFKANYDAANALDIISTCVLINTKSSY